MSHPWRFCLAPMMRYSDRHFRVLCQLLMPQARAYTEMSHAEAVLRQGFNHPDLRGDRSVALEAFQLGGRDPQRLAEAAALIESRGYAEVNLNVGCPSDQVQSGAFGAALMKEPEQVARCLEAMRAAVSIPVTIKTRLGVDEHDSEGFLRHFIDTVSGSGVRVWCLHARKAWLKGLSPKANRDVPPLLYDRVYRMKAAYPDALWIINGGVRNARDLLSHLAWVDGVMVGRVAIEQLATTQALYQSAFPDDSGLTIAEAIEIYADYVLEAPDSHNALVKPLMSLSKGLPGGKAWRASITGFSGSREALVEKMRDLAEAARCQPCSVSDGLR